MGSSGALRRTQRASSALQTPALPDGRGRLTDSPLRSSRTGLRARLRASELFLDLGRPTGAAA